MTKIRDYLTGRARLYSACVACWCFRLSENAGKFAQVAVRAFFYNVFYRPAHAAHIFFFGLPYNKARKCIMSDPTYMISGHLDLTRRPKSGTQTNIDKMKAKKS